MSVFQKIWKPYTKLCIKDDGAGWVLSGEAMELKDIAKKLDIHTVPSKLSSLIDRQSIFYSDQFSLLNQSNYEANNRYAFAYFHGRPGAGIPEFDDCYKNLKELRDRIHRIQVSHRAMMDVVLDAGVQLDRVHLIPIGINTSVFYQVNESKDRIRSEYQIPHSAVVIGSFQKDGNGWGEGNEPKLIKGPDVFLKVIENLKPRIPELFVLLTGPARGYVKAGLERLNIPYSHIFVKSYNEIARLYRSLDLYLVTSREEGGPKAILESMASGVPLISTRVGQATDLVRHGENGWLADVDDMEGLAHLSEWVLSHGTELKNILEEGRRTAHLNSYDSQIPLWRNFFRGFVEP